LQRFQIDVGDEYLLVEDFQFIFVYLPAGMWREKRDDASTNNRNVSKAKMTDAAHIRARAG
jgi:hypothetical protein